MPHAGIHRDEYYVTAMASVAGAVADEILSVMRDAAELDRIYVNNGGDIALYLDPAAVAVRIIRSASVLTRMRFCGRMSIPMRWRVTGRQDQFLTPLPAR